MVPIIRTVLVGVLLLGTSALVYWRVSAGDLARARAELEALQREMTERLAAKDEMIQRLGRSRRLAHIHVTDQRLDGAGVVTETELLFIELDDDGRELARQEFTLPGDVLFVDAWTVKFHQADVAEGHPLRGAALVLFRRVYSDRMAPADGYPLDVPGAVPAGYAAGEVAEFERRVWAHFWDLATDPELAAAMGVRVAQGEAVYKPVRAGQVFELSVDAAGGMSLKPLPVSDVVRG